MAQALVDDFKPAAGQGHPIEEIILVPGSKGMFEISVDGELVHSKLASGQHIGDREAIRLIRRHVER